jgi:TrmH family RNA methyltransferase
VRQFVQAFDAGLQFETIVWSPILLKSVCAERISRILKTQGVQRVRVTPEQFRSVYLADRASGIGAIVRQHWTPLERAIPNRGLAWVIVEEVRNAGNLGTILRTAEATEASGLICVGPSCDPFDPAVVRASMGGMFHLPLIRTSCDELAAWCRQHAVHLVGLSPEGEKLWTEIPVAPAIGIVVGEERKGMTPALRNLCHTLVRLPMSGRADSLNVGVAAGVILYELLRNSPVRAVPPRDFQ